MTHAQWLPHEPTVFCSVRASCLVARLVSLSIPARMDTGPWHCRCRPGGSGTQHRNGIESVYSVALNQSQVFSDTFPPCSRNVKIFHAYSLWVCVRQCVCVCVWHKRHKIKSIQHFFVCFFFFSYLCFRNNNANGKNTRAQLLEHSLRPLAITLSSPSFLSLSLFLTCFSFFWGQQKTIAEITFAVPNWHCNYWIFLNCVYVCVSVLKYISSIP